MADQINEALVRRREFQKRTGMSNTTFYSRIREGKIKPGVPLGPRMKAWPESEVQAYINSCIAARDANESVVIVCHPRQQRPVNDLRNALGLNCFAIVRKRLLPFFTWLFQVVR